MTILFSGGGTMGPVTPLLAVLRQMKKRRPDLKFAWAGTPNGPERSVIEKEGVPFYAIPVAKLPRHASLEWFGWPFAYLSARSAAKKLITAIKPELVVSAGGFTAEPVTRIAHRAGITCAIHQLDLEPGLANKSVARLCQSVTTSFAYEVAPFPGVVSEQLPTPSRCAGVRVLDKPTACDAVGLDPNRPIVFVTGGGTGAAALNQAIADYLDELLSFTQIIHLTGKGKLGAAQPRVGYVVAEFFDEAQMLRAFCAADVVVSRAGMGSMADLASLSKAAIFVPIPGGQQEANVAKFPSVIHQGMNFGFGLKKVIRDLLQDATRRTELGKALHQMLPTDDGSALAERWMKLI